jgi:uncharacterized protein YdaU (DUF1376 family)
MAGTQKQRFPYFKFYPRDWLEGTRGMSLEERGAYIDLICIMMEEEGHLEDRERAIAHQLHISTRKWRAVRDRLVEHKKIHVEGGLIIQERCLKELDSLLSQRSVTSESASNRERTKRENLEKLNEFNGSYSTVVPLRARVTSDSDLDRREESSLRSDSPASPSAEPVAASDLSLEDPGWILFNKATPELAKRAGKTDKAVKALIGKWRKIVTDEELLKIARDAYRAADPVSYISGIVLQHEQAILHAVRRENGRLVVVNGFKAELEEILKGENLERALIKIDGKIGGHVIGADLQRRVRMLAAELVDQKADQDRRYQAAVKAREPAQRGDGSPRSKARVVRVDGQDMLVS